MRRGGERLLIDCGEGTQRQLLRSDLGLVDLQEIFLTHFHADHFLGLPGMLKTFALRGRELPLTLYGPRGLDELFQSLRRIFGRLTFEVAVVELAPARCCSREGYALRTFPVTPRARRDRLRARRGRRGPGRFDVEAADALGVPFGRERGALQQGEAVTLADGREVDPGRGARRGRGPAGRSCSRATRLPRDLVVEAAYGADLLVHEATFCEDEAERAAETEHSTALEAARVGQGRERPPARADAQSPAATAGRRRRA